MGCKSCTQVLRQVKYIFLFYTAGPYTLVIQLIMRHLDYFETMEIWFIDIWTKDRYTIWLMDDAVENWCPVSL